MMLPPDVADKAREFETVVDAVRVLSNKQLFLLRRLPAEDIADAMQAAAKRGRKPW